MDIQTLAQQLVTVLTPFLPYLVKAREGAIEEVGKKFGEAAWEQARALWGKLRGKERVAQAAQAAAALPENEAIQKGLQAEIADALKADPSLADEIARLLGKTPVAGTGKTVIASGERSVAIGGSVSGSTIITGDRNR